MAITAQDVNKLRQETGAGMMDCKKALTEANGDFQAAIDILRKKGQKVSAARANNQTSEGGVFIKTTADGSKGYLVAISCETDFVAKNEDFSGFGNKVTTLALENDVTTLEDLKGISLEDGISIGEKIVDMMGKIGEKIEISAFEVLTADVVVPYIHSNNKLGVMVALDGAKGSAAEEIGKDVAMQIAAMNPVALGKEDVAQDIIDRELDIARDLARQEGKPENMIDKIAEGRLTKFFKENTLLSQAFVKDNSKSIEQVVKEADKNLKVTAFKRVNIG